MGLKQLRSREIVLGECERIRFDNSIRFEIKWLTLTRAWRRGIRADFFG